MPGTAPSLPGSSLQGGSTSSERRSLQTIWSAASRKIDPFIAFLKVLRRYFLLVAPRFLRY
jgi:hypothetical protein